MQSIRDTRAKYPSLQITAATWRPARAHVRWRKPAQRGEQGSACSICTIKRDRCGRSAVSDAVEALEGTGIPVIADGGIRFSGDIAKAISRRSRRHGWFDVGRYEESPGEIELYQGRSYKSYRGMGSWRDV
ncbi:MAG: IMP dehydrogenase [Enterobacteriaceae bacterium]